jgi:hypothetical protein
VTFVLEVSSKPGPLRVKGSGTLRPLPRFIYAPPAFYDFNVWSDRKVREKLDYMHGNPVQRKLVSHPKDWPWNSWSHYEKGETVLIRIDTLAEEKSPASLPRRKSQKPHP